MPGPSRSAPKDRPLSREERGPGGEVRPAAVFCDFDGTITESDMIVSIWRQFAPPGWEQVKDDMLARRKTVREGVAQVFAQIPSARKQEIIDHALRAVRFRAGLQAFLEFCAREGLPFYVTSGALDFFIEPVMAPYRRWLAGVYSIATNLSGPMIRLVHTHACETCGLCKVRAMREHPGVFSILIGDSVTDLHGAMEANLVFARDRLKAYLDEARIAYEPFETFHDIQRALETKHLRAAGARP